jgi:hypothetical protein
MKKGDVVIDSYGTRGGGGGGAGCYTVVNLYIFVTETETVKQKIAKWKIVKGGGYI